MNNTTVEKRLHKRCLFEREVEVWRQDGDSHSNRKGICYPEACRSLNISAGGMQLATPHTLPLHSVVKLDFRMFEERPVQVFAKVVWSSSEDCGLKFLNFDGPMSF
jgi:hypothetical protein